MKPALFQKIMVFMLLLTLWGAITIQSLRDRDQALSAAANNTANLARAFEEHVIKTVQNIDGLLLQLRHVFSESPGNLKNTIDRLAQHKATTELLIQLSITDRNGIMIFNTKEMPKTPLDLSDREHIKVHQQRTEDFLFISKPVLGRVSQKWSIQFTRKVFDHKGNYNGAMVLSIDPDYFSDYYKTINIGNDGIVSIAGTDRVIRARAPKLSMDREAKGQELPADRPYFLTDSPQYGNYTISSVIDGVTRIGAYRKLQEYPLVVLVMQSRSEALKEVINRMFYMFSAGVLLTIAILLATRSYNRSKNRQAALHEEIVNSEEFLRTLFNQLPVGAVILEHDCRISKSNNTFKKIIGYSEEELSEISVCKIINIPNRRTLEQCCDKKSGIMIDQIEAVCFDKTGGHIPVILTASPVYFNNGELRFSIITVQDITVLKQTEESLLDHQNRLRQLNADLENRVAEEVAQNRKKDSLLLQQDKLASIGQLAAGIAHEINNPIGFVMSNLSTLGRYASTISDYCSTIVSTAKNSCSSNFSDELERIAKKNKVSYILADINNLVDESLEGTERVKRIVMDLKDFARIDEKGARLYDLNDCVKSTINMVRNEIKYVAELDLQLGELPQIMCSPNQINQVIANLLINAAHSIEKHGKISVSTAHSGEQVLLQIIDTGCGMSEDVRQKIFEPFFTTKEVGKGTGLGLTICYDIIKKHNGTITVESSPGVGTTFTISLPVN